MRIGGGGGFKVNLRQISAIKNMPVLDLETGVVLGRVVSWVVHPRDQRIAAFLLDKTFPFQKWPVIVPADIAEYGPRMIIARSREVIIVSQEVVGLPELIKQKTTFTGFGAETISGKILGRVSDLAFDTITSRIQKYHIRPHGLASAVRNELILPANKVIKIQKKHLIFPDDITAPQAAPLHKSTQVIQRV